MADQPFGGFYFGGHAGYGEVVDETPELGGFAGGVHTGYNIQSGAMVFGIEGDYSWLDMSDSDSDFDVTLDYGFNYLASVRGRIGYATSSALFFATAGYSWSEFEVSATDGVDSLSASFTLDGFVTGGGIEYKFTQNLSGRVEGLYYFLGGEQFGEELEADLGVVRAGVSYHLN